MPKKQAEFNNKAESDKMTCLIMETLTYEGDPNVCFTPSVDSPGPALAQFLGDTRMIVDDCVQPILLIQLLVVH